MAEPLSLPSPAPEEYGVGSLIDGKYRLERPLGEGGQASVWQARHVELDSPVAIKIAVGARDEPERGARLLLEGQAASRIGHPGIAKVFDVGRTAAGDPFLVMEFLEGETLLTAVTRAGRLSPVETLRLMLPIAHALAAAHDEGLVHRDVKPENVFLARCPSGSGVQPKLLDFGVVKVLNRRRDCITAAGAVVGSPAFLSPEQARGDASVDERSDTWSFCVTIYVALTGQLPFPCQSYQRLVRAILDEPPTSILELGVGDEELWSILSRGLAKASHERWSTMRELGSALAGWLLARGVEKDACDNDLVSEWSGVEEPESRIVLRAPADPEPVALPVKRPGVLSRPRLVVAGLALLTAGVLTPTWDRWKELVLPGLPEATAAPNAPVATIVSPMLPAPEPPEQEHVAPPALVAPAQPAAKPHFTPAVAHGRTPVRAAPRERGPQIPSASPASSLARQLSELERATAQVNVFTERPAVVPAAATTAPPSLEEGEASGAEPEKDSSSADENQTPRPTPNDAAQELINPYGL